VSTEADARAEIAAYDRLGPLARAALRRSPKDVNARGLVARYSFPVWHNGSRRPPDLTEPELDRAIADLIDTQVRKAFGRPLEAFELKARRPARDPVSLRLRARYASERGSSDGKAGISLADPLRPQGDQAIARDRAP